jgi:hypothetical protein
VPESFMGPHEYWPEVGFMKNISLFCRGVRVGTANGNMPAGTHRGPLASIRQTR